MASSSFTLTSPKTSILSTPSSQSNPTHKSSVAFRPDRRSNPPSLPRFRLHAAVNEAVVEKSANNNVPIANGISEKSPPSTEPAAAAVDDDASVSAFMSQVADLVKLVDSRDIVELELKQLDCEVVIRKKEALQQNTNAAAPVVMMQPQQHFQPQPQFNSAPFSAPSTPAPATTPPPPASIAEPPKPTSSHPPLICPMAGTFYRASAPGAAPFVKVGDKVQKGQVVCIIEAMKLMNEIEADQSGTIVEILVDDGKPVSADVPLLIIEP